MSYAVRIKPSAEKVLGKLSRQAQSRIAEIIEALAEDPHPPGNVKLHGEDGLYRVRVGDYRILYQIEDEELTVLVVRIGHRREVYRRL